MAETIQASMSVNLTAVLNQNSGIGTGTFNAPLNAIIAQLVTGNAGAGKADQVYYSQRSLATSSSENIDLYSPPLGSGTDAFGNALTITHVKMLVIQNLGQSATTTTPTESDTLIIGAGGATTQCTSILTPNTSGLVIPGGGCLILTSPGAIGYLVGNSSTNHILKIATGGADTTFYNLWIVGATA